MAFLAQRRGPIAPRNTGSGWQRQNTFILKVQLENEDGRRSPSGGRSSRAVGLSLGPLVPGAIRADLAAIGLCSRQNQRNLLAARAASGECGGNSHKSPADGGEATSGRGRIALGKHGSRCRKANL